jgi:hypothetical protein
VRDFPEEKLQITSRQLSRPPHKPQTIIGVLPQSAALSKLDVPPATLRPSPNQANTYYYTTPPVALARFLDMKKASEREKYWLHIRGTSSPRSLPIITIYYLIRSSGVSVPLTQLCTTILTLFRLLGRIMIAPFIELHLLHSSHEA